MNLFSDIRALVIDSLAAMQAEGALPAGLDMTNVAVEPPRDAAHGDMATNAAMVLAKPAGLKPRDIAEALARRLADQDQVLDDGAAFVKPGGRLVYVTCSVLPEEDEDRVAAFLARHSSFKAVPATDDPMIARHMTPDGYLRLSPYSSGTDGFFVAVLKRDT